MCKKKNSKAKLILAKKMVADEEIMDSMRATTVYLEILAASDPVHKKLEDLL